MIPSTPFSRLRGWQRCGNELPRSASSGAVWLAEGVGVHMRAGCGVAGTWLLQRPPRRNTDRMCALACPHVHMSTDYRQAHASPHKQVPAHRPRLSCGSSSSLSSARCMRCTRKCVESGATPGPRPPLRGGGGGRTQLGSARAGGERCQARAEAARRAGRPESWEAGCQRSARSALPARCRGVRWRACMQSARGAARD